MLWAIDVGNTHTVFGLYRDGQWDPVHRFVTHSLGTEDEIAARLKALMGELPGAPVTIASVNPIVEEDISRFSREYLRVEPKYLRKGSDVGIDVRYQPESAVGADRIANVLGALEFTKPPFIVVDFGTATTFDVVSADGAYEGGAILPGPDTLMDSLTAKTAKLPRVPLVVPQSAIGRDTPSALQSGVVLGYIGAIRTILDRTLGELGAAEVMTTGGLGKMMVNLVPELGKHYPNLTLDGLRKFYERFC